MMEQTIEQTIPVDKALIYNTKFGEVTLREDRLISFPQGMLGFSDCTVFGLSKLPNSDDSQVMLLQCINDTDVGFLVADPQAMGLTIAQEDIEKAMKETGMDAKSTQIVVVLTMYEQGDSYYMTANLKAPIMIDSEKRLARQHILSNKEYTTQHKI